MNCSVYLAGGFGASKTRSCVMEKAGAFSVVAVCVSLMNFACIGLKVMTEFAPVPCPAATCVHVVPFSDVSTLYPRG